MGFLWDIYNSLADEQKSADSKALFDGKTAYGKTAENNSYKMDGNRNKKSRGFMSF